MNLVYVDLKYVPEPKARKLIPGRSRWQPWRLVIKSGDNQKTLFKGSERWTNREDAVNAADVGFGAGTTVFLREAEQGNRLLRRAVEAPPF